MDKKATQTVEVEKTNSSAPNTIESSTVNFEQQSANQNTVTKKRFEVEIYDKVAYGEPPMEQIKLEKVKYDEPVIIEATCKKDLQDFAAKLALCQQTFKIVKVLDDVVVPVSNNNSSNVSQPSSTTNQPTNTQTQAVRQKPKYYKVGDVEIKDDNGVIYQKQWLRLTEAEASNFRIINDKTNSIFNLKDKHIEMKKWVLVKSSEDETADLEESLK